MQRGWRHGLMGVLFAAAMLAGAAGAVLPPSADGLRPGDYRWTPDLAPRGPLVVVVSVPEQRAYVYRNGVRIGLSTVSTGRPGYDTPPGIYSVLQKERQHASNLYDNAPMPWMQRLTWDGLALHAGALPGQPASHGCVRLPAGFAERLFAATARGTTVVIADARSDPPVAVAPGWFAPVDAAGRPAPAPDGGAAETWQPALAPEGPLSILVGLRERRMLVLRNGVVIGQAPIGLVGAPPTGTRAYVLLEGTLDAPSPLVAERPRLRWMRLRLSQPAGEAAAPEPAAAEADWLALSPAFARRVYDILSPGATVVVTDEPLHPQSPETRPLLDAEAPQAHP